jgi:hypothetical protein
MAPPETPLRINNLTAAIQRAVAFLRTDVLRNVVRMPLSSI